MCVYAESAGPGDILAAVRSGHGFLTFSPGGPTLELTACEAIMGDSVRWPEVKEVRVRVQKLLGGDAVRVVTGRGSEVLFTAPSGGDVSLCYAMEAPGFVRAEVLRAFVPGMPAVPAALSNPIYFDGPAGQGFGGSQLLSGASRARLQGG